MDSTREERTLEAAIDRLFGALTDPRAMDDAMAGIATAFDATACNYIRVAPEGTIVQFSEHGHDPSAIEVFVSHYAELDPTRPVAARRAPGDWLQDDRLLDPALNARSEFIHDFALRCGLRWLRGGKVFEDARGSAYLSLHRPSAAPPFDAQTLQLLDRLLPDFRRFSRLRQELDAWVPALGAGREALEQLDVAVLVVDGRCHVRYANPAAEALLRADAGLALHGSALQFTHVEAQRRLARAVRDATGYARRASAFCPDLLAALTRRLQVRVLPLEPMAGLSPALAERQALVFVTRGFRPLRAEDCIALFGLSPAEGELLSLLAQGLSPAACADRRGVNITTVRTHLRGLYAKTGAKSLAQLMTFVLAMPALRPDD